MPVLTLTSNFLRRRPGVCFSVIRRRSTQHIQHLSGVELVRLKRNIVQAYTAEVQLRISNRCLPHSVSSHELDC